MLKNENPLMKDGITFYNGIFVNSHLMEMAFHFEMGNFENPMHFLAPVQFFIQNLKREHGSGGG
jgi:hypothetical protein